MRRGERGFTFIGLLALLVLSGLMLAAAGEVASTAGRRERETQLLWAGRQYRLGIARYWSRYRKYPATLQDLLGGEKDALPPIRSLRSLYPDPMTNAVDWVLLPAPDGGILGVASSSKRAPLKTGGFDEIEKDFADATSYGGWQFVFTPLAIRSVR